MSVCETVNQRDLPANGTPEDLTGGRGRAARRKCNPKTVYTFTLNIRTRLEIDTKNGWFDLLSRIVRG